MEDGQLCLSRRGCGSGGRALRGAIGSHLTNATDCLDCGRTALNRSSLLDTVIFDRQMMINVSYITDPYLWL